MCVLYILLMWRIEPGRPIFACNYISNSPKKEWLGRGWHVLCIYNRIMGEKGGRLLCCAAKGGLFIYLLLLLLILWDDRELLIVGFQIPLRRRRPQHWHAGLHFHLYRLNIFLSFPFLSFFFLYPFHVYVHHSADETGRGGYYLGSNEDFSFFSSYTQEY